MKNKSMYGLKLYFMVVLGCSLTAKAYTEPVKWDYTLNPVRVTESPAASTAVNLLVGLCAQSAFDGFGAQGSRPGATRAWHQPSLPTAQKPFICDIDYGSSVAVSAFVHYFYVPDGLDYRYTNAAPSSFCDVRVMTSDDGNNWTQRALLKNLRTECPQVMSIPEGPAARFWRLEAERLSPDAGALMTYEIETWTGGIPVISADLPRKNFQKNFVDRVTSHKPLIPAIKGQLTLRQEGIGFDIDWQKDKSDIKAQLSLLMEGREVSLTAVRKNYWRGALSAGEVFVKCRPTHMGLLLELTYQAKPEQPLRFQSATVKMAVPNPSLYYMPAYVWSRTPVETAVNTCNVQTRFAALECQDAMLCLIPGTDRGTLGFSGNSVQNTLILGPQAMPVLLTAIKGDWWTAYRFAASDMDNFQELPQRVALSEIVQGTSHYLMSDEVWEPHVGTLKSWPARDPHTKLYGNGHECFALYGVPYSIPIYLSRYIANADANALGRAASIVHWLCRSGVRMQEGPARGAFFTGQHFINGETPTMEKRGCSQAITPILTSQSTGACLWSLLYFRKVTQCHDPEIDKIIDEAAAWLLKTQLPDGGWPYGHDVNGVAVPNAAPSSGCIWNIWALWRLGQETGQSQYTQSAKKAIPWYVKTYMEPHHFHGYWEDAGPGSRQGYDAAIAAVALGEIGEKDLAIRAAQDAVQWVFTRQIEPREADCSAGLVAEQTGWPPGFYCNPMMGLAAWNAWQFSGDSFWKPYAMIPKAIGWWYQPECGAMVWILDNGTMAPILGKVAETWWTDWCIAQPGTLSQRWLIREFKRRSGGAINLDEELLHGIALGRAVRYWSPPEGLHPAVPVHGQVNWLGLRGGNEVMIAFFNDGIAGEVNCHLNSRNGIGIIIQPCEVYSVHNGKLKAEPWDGHPVQIDSSGLVVLKWSIRQ